jgi:MFS family permease
MDHPYLQAVERTLLTFWIGGLWTTGFVVAPLLFAELADRALAGSLAGAIFGVMSYAGLACGACLLLISWLLRDRRRFIAWPTFVIVAMLVLTACGEFVLAPWIAGLREAGLTESARFAQAHGLASGVFLVNCVLGLVLVSTGRRDGA